MTTNDDGPTAPGDDRLTVATVRAWVVLAMRLLTEARPVINEANVFPVADSDTGTNLCLTLGDGRDALDALGPGVGLDEALRALARGALLGARGNSGIILSEYLRGFALGVARTTGPRAAGASADARAVVTGLLEASRCAYEAVGHPREGTMLTAAAGAAQAADAAASATPAAGLREIVDVARAGAHAALDRSVHELDVLRTANVLDAGAYGLVLILDALGLALAATTEEGRSARSVASMSEGAGTIVIMDSLAVTDPGAHPSRPTELERTSDSDDSGAARDGVGGERVPHVAPHVAPHTAVDGEFEVMFVVEHTAALEEIATVGAVLRERLLQVGDSVVVVGGADSPVSQAGAVTGTWQVHVHTDAPLEALRAAQGWTQRQVVVRCLPTQIAARAHGAQPQHGLVACIASPGLVTDLARSGAVVVLRASAPIGTDDLRRGALETTAAHVLLLPGDPATVECARTLEVAAAAAAGPDGLPSLEVVETVSDLHVVAAVSAWVSAPEPPAADDDDDADAAAAPAARRDAVRTAVGSVRAVTIDGRDVPGLLDALGVLLAGVCNGPDAVLTVLTGDLVTDEGVSTLTAEATRRHPGIEIVVLASGRRSAAVVMGVDEL